MNNSPLVTIFTPTYNRAQTIIRTYNSLLEQSSKDFEWLIIDDGSTDNTSQLIEDLIKNADFPIRYILKKNGGKHTAHNEALKHAEGDLFFTVDSDDWLPQDAISNIKILNDKICNDPKLSGIIGLKQFSDGSIIGSCFPETLSRKSFGELAEAGIRGEWSIVFKTDLIKRYPFPVIQNEKFMPEGILYEKIGKDEKFLVENTVFTTCEYQPDGLSSNPQTLMVKNPGAYFLYFRNHIDLAHNFIERTGTILRYHVFRKLYNGEAIKHYKGPHKLLVSLLRPLTNITINRYYRTFIK
ncbi:MAG: glycosyltransferase family 2 protein [Bacteroides sp.]|nr:glycosyltransferase family 2 protein [Bacteroides sp.]